MFHFNSEILGFPRNVSINFYGFLVDDFRIVGIPNLLTDMVRVCFITTCALQVGWLGVIMIVSNSRT